MPSESNKKEIISLIADIGGTNTRLQLIKFKEEDTRPTIIKAQVYKTKDEAKIDDCLVEFLQEFRDTETWPESATLAVAGAPFNNKLRMVNTSWPEIDGDKLARDFDIHSVKLINDSEAIGYSLLHVKEEELVTIHDVRRQENGHKAVAGAGTGLGCCVLHSLVNDDGSCTYRVFPSEGGHKDFAPTDRIDFDFQQFCLEENPQVKGMGYLSTERAFCGPAIPYMYKFFARREGAEEKELSPKEIFQAAIDKTDPIARKTLDYYVKLYGKEVSNFALDCLPYGGIFLVGSMVNGVVDYFANEGNSLFLKAYLSKDKITNENLKRCPVYIVTNTDLGILGAFAKAKVDAFAKVK